MKKIVYYIIFFTITTFAQSYYLPLNYQKAFKNNTRDLKGTPGKNYWQNSANYNIKVHVDPQKRELFGSETITYFNNSPDTLKEIVFNVYSDLFKYESARDFNIRRDALFEGTNLKKIVVNGELINTSNNKSFQRSGTLFRIILTNPLLPKNKINIEIEWSHIVPNVSAIRTGFYDYGNALIAYFYPRIAVYDDIDGWDNIEYTGLKEFYNDFCNYKVEINVPESFGVWATGSLQNPEEVLTPEVLKRFNSARNSNEVIKILTKEDFGKEYKSNKFVFSADNVTDFAFGIGSKMMWDASTLTLPNGKKVFVHAVYNPASQDFYEVCQLTKDVLFYLSNDIPAYNYPYPSMTAFNGSGGMEYPMMVNDASLTTRSGTVHLTAHEVTHSYFPFFMGTNEEKYAFMDEGFAVALPMDFEQVEGGEDVRAKTISQFESFAGKEGDIPLMIPSTQLSGYSYRHSAYIRSAIAYLMLREFLGDKRFNSSMHEYMNRWNSKHPSPYDFFNTFSDVLKTDMSWYFKPWFFESGYPDLSLKSVKIKNDDITIEVEKIGNLPVPVKITLLEDELTTKEILKLDEFYKDKNKVITIKAKMKNVKKIMLGDIYIPDIDRSNNIYEVKQ